MLTTALIALAGLAVLALLVWLAPQYEPVPEMVKRDGELIVEMMPFRYRFTDTDSSKDTSAREEAP